MLFEDIYEFYVEDGYSILFTNQHKKYFPDKSLDKIEGILPQEWFFRLNRQFIMHRKSVTGFKRGDDGKIDVLVNAAENFTAAIQVSRTKAAAFKKWFQAEKLNYCCISTTFLIQFNQSLYCNLL